LSSLTPAQYDKVSVIIERFLDELEKNHIDVEQAILFGSYAQGTYSSWSDIDLASFHQIL